MTPMFEQFHAAKAEHPDALLFFRMGDFYELFYDDAVHASRVLGIALTSRNKGADHPVPMAGVPVKSVDGHLQKLVRNGHRVAICEQIQDPREAKGIVERAVVRVVTPGTLTEDSALDDRAHNFLVAARTWRDRLGLAWVDLSTGRFELTEVAPGRLADELARLGPAEVLLPDKERALDDGIEGAAREAAPAALVALQPDWAFGIDGGRKAISDHFGVGSLDGFDADDLRPAIGCAGAILHYLDRTQRTALRHLRNIRRVRPETRMHLDRATRRTLELDRKLRGDLGRDGTLLGVLDLTRTSMGSRLLGDWIRNPLVDIEAIEARQDAIGSLFDDDVGRGALRERLDEVADLERIASRLGTERASARDLVALGASLQRVPSLAAAIAGRPALAAAVGPLDPLTALADEIGGTLVDDPPMTLKEGGLIRDGHDAELDRLRTIQRDANAWMEEYRQQLIARTGIETLKVGFNRVHGYYIEVSRAQSVHAPDDFIRRQTLKNSERYITPELKEFEETVLSADEKAHAREYETFLALRARAVESLPPVLETAAALARLDALGALAEVARERGYVRPRVDDSVALEIEGGRHPVLDRTEVSFVPNDTRMDAGRPIHLITGPNMAGKSTYIRQVALIALMAQTGSYVPADRARVGLVDRIFTRIGSADELSRGQSTFMVEMSETANILNHATERSLVVLDEVGRGTSTFDGVAIAWSIAEHLRGAIRARTLFATHYHELTDLASVYPEVANFQVAVREDGDRIAFLHRIVAGGTDRSYGLHVARLAGIPGEVVERAGEILGRLEQGAPDPTGTRSAAEARGGPPGAGVGPRPRRRRQASLLFDLYDDTLDVVRDLQLEGMSPEEALETLKRIRADLDANEQI